MIIRYLILVFALISGLTNLEAQLSGVVRDSDGVPLSYASIYIQNTSIGTTTNADGAYHFDLTPGDYTLIFQFIGFKTEVRKILLNGAPIQLDLVMHPQATLLSEVVIAADAEDPAYAIIRKAIAKRSFYKNYFPRYSCDVYVKGHQKVKNVPDKFMGQEIGDLDGALDSNRQGIVYLSESISSLHVDGDQYKEIVTSSKISGDDRGYSFNSAREMEFDFYSNTIDLERQMVTPIADNAFNFYKYRLEGTFEDESGLTVNEISVIPKHNTDPAFYGKIYIVEDLWSIHSLQLSVNSSGSKIYVLDTLTFTQIFIPIANTEGSALFTNTITFGLTILGVKFYGEFSAVYSDYDMMPRFSSGFFDAYVHIVEKESRDRDSTYWESVRPLPLTLEESRDYVRRDSIAAVRKSPMYMDSVDGRHNRLGIGVLIGGYNYKRRSKHLYWSVSSPLTSLQFNTVQGYNGTLKIDGRKYFDEDETRRILFGVSANYGLSEGKVRAKGFITYRPSRINIGEVTLSGGSDIPQFNMAEPISATVNSLYSLFLKDNYAKFYDIKFLQLRHFHEPFTGVYLSQTLRWEDRRTLRNSTDYSFFYKEDFIRPNHPLNVQNRVELFDPNQLLRLDLNATIRFGQKYTLFPDRKFSHGATGPRLQLTYSGAFDIGGADVSFHKIAASLDDQWSVGVGGRFQWYVNAGTYVSTGYTTFADYRHFMGNEIFFTKDAGYRRSFMLLPYYEYSTDGTYFQTHLQHHFDGWILDRIPGLRSLGWSLVAGAKYLDTSDKPAYAEFHMGIDNIGLGLFRLIRLDGVVSFSEGASRWGVRMALGF